VCFTPAMQKTLFKSVRSVMSVMGLTIINVFQAKAVVTPYIHDTSDTHDTFKLVSMQRT